MTTVTGWCSSPETNRDDRDDRDDSRCSVGFGVRIVWVGTGKVGSPTYLLKLLGSGLSFWCLVVIRSTYLIRKFSRQVYLYLL